MVDHTRMDLADDARRAVGRQRIRDRARRRPSPSRCLKHTLPLERLGSLDDSLQMDRGFLELEMRQGAPRLLCHADAATGGSTTVMRFANCSQNSRRASQSVYS